MSNDEYDKKIRLFYSVISFSRLIFFKWGFIQNATVGANLLLLQAFCNNYDYFFPILKYYVVYFSGFKLSM